RRERPHQRNRLARQELRRRRSAMTVVAGAELVARRIHIQGVVQGVGFRPFVFRLAHAYALRGWVKNGGEGLRVHVEGSADALDTFVRELTAHAPPASQ